MHTTPKPEISAPGSEHFALRLFVLTLLGVVAFSATSLLLTLVVR